MAGDSNQSINQRQCRGRKTAMPGDDGSHRQDWAVRLSAEVVQSSWLEEGDLKETANWARCTVLLIAQRCLLGSSQAPAKAPGRGRRPRTADGPSADPPRRGVWNRGGSAKAALISSPASPSLASCIHHHRRPNRSPKPFTLPLSLSLLSVAASSCGGQSSVRLSSSLFAA